MPELFGIFNSSGLDQTHREGFSRMHAVFSNRTHFNTLTKETPCLLISLFLNNKYESKYNCIEWNDITKTHCVSGPLYKWRMKNKKYSYHPGLEPIWGKINGIF